MIRFKRPELAEQFERVPDVLRQVVADLDTWSLVNLLPEPMLTCVDRTEEENAEVGGVPDSLHLYRLAVDLRCTHYTAHQRKRVEAWLRFRCPRNLFELILKPHGTGPHYHVGLRRTDGPEVRNA